MALRSLLANIFHFAKKTFLIFEIISELLAHPVWHYLISESSMERRYYVVSSHVPAGRGMQPEPVEMLRLIIKAAVQHSCLSRLLAVHRLLDS